MDSYNELNSIIPSLRVVGTKQILKGLSQGNIQYVVIARDADVYIKERLLDALGSAGVEVRYCDSKAELGKICDIDVGAAAAAVLRHSD